jgi:hypothetical protein
MTISSRPGPRLDTGESECECLLSEPANIDAGAGGVRGLEDEDDNNGIPGFDDDGRRLGLSVTNAADQQTRSVKTWRLNFVVDQEV